MAELRGMEPHLAIGRWGLLGLIDTLRRELLQIVKDHLLSNLPFCSVTGLKKHLELERFFFTPPCFT